MVKLSTMTDHLYSRSTYCFIGLLAAGCKFIGRNKKLARCLIYMASENRHWIPQKPHKYVSGGLRYLVLYYQSRKVVKGPEAKVTLICFKMSVIRATKEPYLNWNIIIKTVDNYFLD